ncbi:helix-turn-helix domain-containing protein [Aquimarina algiphila]|uniref:HTH cro/C1-type domain-containing protein n=1 Tax=Aquimarina algiphila TaxID=2047982 RepID=A0A554VRP9_9FLAO|nr:helix-turn-helix transcriptional regulator [Aquimarina algiphila]TSE11332.1 hypothetical protein FOF46_01500 [Aquimarina algiphila]
MNQKDKIYKVLGSEIKRTRRALGYSQGTLAEKAFGKGAVKSNISEIETGKINMTTDRLIKVLDALEIKDIKLYR